MNQTSSVDEHPQRPPTQLGWHRRCLLAIYDGLWTLALAGWVVYRLCRGGDARDEIAQRLGRVPCRPAGRSLSLWIHAVSVGELASIRPVLVEVRRLRPDAWIFLTTSNEAAYQMARQQETVADALCRMPVDAGPVVRRALDRARPDAVAIVECEIWPNFILEAARRATLFMINARIYERDYPRYRAAGWFFRPIIEQVALIGAQTSADAERFLGLGVRRRRVQVIGNTKFDSVRVPKSGSSAKLSRSDLRLKDGPLWVLASTHPGEESAILEALAVRDFVAIRLVIAPRDIRRADEIAQACSWRGWHVARRTKPGEKPVDVMILDTLGELVDVLPLADLVFVGGSLVDRGGHNPIEPAAWGKPIVMGPSVYNFADVVDTFRDADALEICANAQELVDRAIELMNQVDRRRRLGERSQRVVASRRGAALVYAALLVDPAWQRRAA